MSGRRISDSVHGSDRRRFHTRRGGDVWPFSTIRFPEFREQALQFLTRYLFAGLALAFFNLGMESAPIWLPLRQLNLTLVLYLVVNSIGFMHAWRWPVSPVRYRVALWTDMVMVTVCVANDPNAIPPSMIAYIVVVLGNGMRYGIQFFAEALVAAMLGGTASAVIRYWYLQVKATPGMLFLSLFGAIIVVYTYILMSRVERSRQRSEQVSRTDPLTGLLNRRGLNEAIDHWVHHRKWSEQKAVVMFADLDNFKAVNDSHGHSEGDRVLVNVATIIRNTLRSTDLVSRYGGDEFVVLLSDVDINAAQVIVSRIKVGVDQWFRENQLACGISIGFGVAPAAEKNLGSLLQSVDRHLYHCKAQRTNGVVPVQLV
jgi:diguanylate cyclase (GGDEF)-like protein